MDRFLVELINFLSSRLGRAVPSLWEGTNSAFGAGGGLPPIQLNQLPQAAIQSSIAFQNSQLMASAVTGASTRDGAKGIDELTASMAKYRKELQEAGFSQRALFDQAVNMSRATNRVAAEEVSKMATESALFSRITGVNLNTISQVSRQVRGTGFTGTDIGSMIQSFSGGNNSQIEEILASIGQLQQQYLNAGVGGSGALQSALSVVRQVQANNNPAFQGANAMNVANVFAQNDLNPSAIMMAANPMRPGEGLLEWNLRLNRGDLDTNKNFLSFLKSMGPDAAFAALGNVPAGTLKELLKLEPGLFGNLTPQAQDAVQARLLTGTQGRAAASFENAMSAKDSAGDRMREAADRFFTSTRNFENSTEIFKQAMYDAFTPGGRFTRIIGNELTSSDEHKTSGLLFGGIPKDLKSAIGIDFKGLTSRFMPKSAGAETLVKPGAKLPSPGSLGDLTLQLLQARGMNDLVVTDGFRTGEEQERLRRMGRTGIHSPHQDNNAIDLRLGKESINDLKKALTGIPNLSIRQDDQDHWHIGPVKGATSEDITKAMLALTAALHTLHSTVQRTSFPADATNVRRAGR